MGTALRDWMSRAGRHPAIREPAVGLSTSVAPSEHLDEWACGVDPAERMVSGTARRLEAAPASTWSAWLTSAAAWAALVKTHALGLILVIRDQVAWEVRGHELCLSS